MAKAKTLLKKLMLHAERVKRQRAPVWAFIRAKKRLLPRFSRINWRYTRFGKILKHKIKGMEGL